MKPSTETLIEVAETFRDAAGVDRMTTISHRVFGDTKKIDQLRRGADITLGRFNAAMAWFCANWPAGSARPDVLAPYAAPLSTEKDVA